MTSWREIAHLPIGMVLRRGLLWWGEALASLLPENWRRLLARWRRELRLVERGGRLELIISGADRVPLGEMTLACAEGEASATTDILVAEFASLLDRDTRPIDRAVLVVDPVQVLERDVMLPRAALADPDAAVELEIDRLTPFRAEDVLFAVRPLAVDVQDKGGAAEASRRELAFRLVLTPRARLDPLFAALERVGLRLDHVNLAGLRAPLSRFRPSLAPNTGRWRVAGALIGMMLLALSVWLPLQQRARLAAARQAQVQRLAPRAAEVAEIVRSLAAMVERERWLVAEKRDRLTVIALLDEVSRAMPDDAFVLQLVQTGERLDLTGYAEKAARLVALLGKAPHLDEPRFTAPVTPDQRLGRERYSLELRVKREKTGTPAAGDGKPLAAGSNGRRQDRPKNGARP